MADTHIEKNPWQFDGAVNSTASTTLAGTTAITGTTTIGSGATFTSPTINTPTIATPTITTATLSGTIDSDIKVLAASATYDNSTTLTTLTGMSWSVVAGKTYQFEINLHTTMTTSGGLAVAFKYTTATLTSIAVRTYAATDSDNSTAVSTQSTTTTDQTKFFNSKTAAYTFVSLKGTFVVNAAGTVAVQAAQETGAAGGDASIVKLGSYAVLNRVN